MKTKTRTTTRIGAVFSGILSLGLLLTHSSAQDIPPLIVVTNTGTLPTNAVERPAPTPAPSPFSPVLPNSPAPATNFQGLDDNNVTWPPDTDGCVGPSNVVTMLNTQVRIQDRSGNTISTTSLLSWWQSRISGLSVVFDPRILYDPYSQRWIATATANPYTGSAILIAVSTNSNPTGGWYAYASYVDTSGYSWADFPTPGFNRNKIVISWNYFPIYVGGADGVGLFVLNKTNVYAGGSVTPQSFYQPYRSGTTTNGYNLRPAVTYDTNDATLYLLQDFQDNPTNSSLLAIYTITGTAGSATLARSTNFPSAPAWASAGPNNGNIAPQLGQPDVPAINTVDSRLSQVVYRNGSLWCAHTIFLPANNPTRCAVQWWQIATNGNVLQNGRLDDSSGATMYAFPSIAVNRFGDALIGYSRFGTNQYASANYSLHALNEPMGTFEPDYLYRAGQSSYWKSLLDSLGRNRWGDYSMTWVDPVNDADFWTIQAYAAQYSGTLTNGSGRWGVWWANVRVAVPTNDLFANAFVLSSSQGTTNGTNLRATKETGEPNHASNAGGASVWYNWTAPFSGSVTFDTLGSSFNTLLAVYTGSSVGSLTAVASDNGSLGSGASRVIFTATSGTTYRVAVDGNNGAMGNVVLNWLQPSAPVFTAQPQSQTVYQGQNVTFTASAIGTPTPTYQWQFNAASISGATSSSYTITGAQTTNAGNYAVVATNSSGSVTSAVAVLTVLTSQATLSSATYSNSYFRLTVGQVSNLTYVIQGNTNLSTTNWIALATNVAPFTFTDSSASNYPSRFYRALYKP